MASYQNQKCEWCDDHGILPVYHRLYDGSQTIWVDRVDRDGEVHQVRVAGVVSVHCKCAKGLWMRDQTDEDARKRIPMLQAVLDGRIPYVIDRPDIPDEERTKESAGRFMQRFREAVAHGDVLPSPPKSSATTVQEIASQLREREKRLSMEGSAVEVERPLPPAMGATGKPA